ncbi:MAG: GntR family transcriptional regulator [Velocimicrobium sp.]
MSGVINTNQPISTEEVYKDIRKRILKLELEPGQKVSENQICQEYNVSRSVIRTVFTRLNQIKLIDVYPQRGTYVSMIDLNHIADLLLLRTAVEKEVLYEMFTKLNKSDRIILIDKLEKNLLEQEKYKTLNIYDKTYRKLDSEFHRIMIDSVKRYELVELLSDHMIHISRWRNFDVAFDRRIPELIEEHRMIVNAIKTDDLQEAQACMANHLETISAINDRAKAKFPQYFTE